MVDHCSLPDGPRAPALLQAAWLGHRPFEYLEWCRDRFGDAFTINTPMMGRVSVFGTPDYLKQIFALDGESLHGGAAQAPLVEFAGDRSIMKLDGATHREHREIMTGVLKPSDLPDNGAQVLAKLRDAVAGWPVGRPFNLSRAIDAIALEMVSDICLGGVPEAQMRAATRALRSVRYSSNGPGRLLSWLIPGHDSGFGKIRGLMERYLDELAVKPEQAEHPSPRCIFARLATQRTERGARLARVDLRDEMLTLLNAMLGGLTCATKHAFYHALRSPGVQARVRSGTSSAVTAGEPARIAGDPFLDSVCREVLRLCPDIPFAVRRTSAPVEVGRWKLPAGMTLGIGIHLIHRREAIYADPDEFKPDRFLALHPSRFEYLPFGGGRRGCLAGALFIHLEKLMLAAVFERFELHLTDPRAIPTTSFALVSSPARPLRAIAERV